MPIPYEVVTSSPSVHLIFTSGHGAVLVMVLQASGHFAAVFSIGTIAAVCEGEQLRTTNLASLDDAKAWAIKAAAERGVALELSSVHGEF